MIWWGLYRALTIQQSLISPPPKRGGGKFIKNAVLFTICQVCCMPRPWAQNLILTTHHMFLIPSSILKELSLYSMPEYKSKHWNYPNILEIKIFIFTESSFRLKKKRSKCSYRFWLNALIHYLATGELTVTCTSGNRPCI